MTDQAPAVRADPDLMEAPFTWRTLKAIADTEFVPAAYRRNPEAILACILTGRELGMGPMESLRRIDVIDGSATPTGEWMISRVFEAGHVVEVVAQDDTICTLKGIRFADGKQVSSMKVSYTIEMARRAGLAQKRNWQQYPEIMLYWRAATMLCRQAFPDVLGGLKYVAEELGDEDWIEPQPAAIKVEGDRFVEVPAVVHTASDGLDQSVTAQVTDVIEDAWQRSESERAAATDPRWEELRMLLDHPHPTEGVRETIERRARKLFLLMTSLGVWPDESWHTALHDDYGVQHWSELKKASMQEFTEKYFAEAAKALVEMGEV